MAWKDYEFSCEECNGTGETECECCGSSTSCEDCDGSGIDSDKVDLPRFRAAEKALKRPKNSTWEIMENGRWVGRTDGETKLYYRDFLIVPNSAPQTP